jgi:mersacidin/lichenicidin family type 2 lantibiotic
MLRDTIIRAWKDPEYRLNLSAEEQALLPENPAGAIELTDDELDMAVGGNHSNQSSYSNSYSSSYNNSNNNSYSNSNNYSNSNSQRSSNKSYRRSRRYSQSTRNSNKSHRRYR